MNLIYVANARMPTERAHGWQIMKMCEAFANNEARLTLLVPRRWRNPYRGDPFDFYRIRRSFKIIYLPCIDLLSFTGSGFFAVFAFKMQAATFAFFVFLYSLFKKPIFFTRDHFSGFLLALLDKKVFFEIHDQPHTTKLMRTFMKNISGLITTNKWKGEAVSRIFGLVKEQILIAYNGVDTDQFLVSEGPVVCRRKLALPSDKKLIVYSGHLYEWKGAYTLARAIRFLPENLEILFVGGTKQDTNDFKKFISIELGEFSDRLRVLGFKRQEEIPHFLCAADVVVVPTSAKENIGTHETSPLKLFEGMAARRSLVVSDTPSAREVVSEREVSFFQPDDEKDLARVVSDVLGNSDRAEEKIKNAWEKVQAMTWNNRVKKILQFMSAQSKIFI